MLIALEGIDGSGKGTQAELLYRRALDAKVPCSKVSYPQYGQTPFANAIAEYLNGKYGDLNQVHPKLSAVLFAGDRFASRRLLERAKGKDSLIVCDRYVNSNLAHQAAKLPKEDRRNFITWLESIEYGVFELPKPDLNIYLATPVREASLLAEGRSRHAQANLAHPEQVPYTDLKMDIHEGNIAYLENCRQVYETLIEESIGGSWAVVPSLENHGSMRPPQVIADDIWTLVQPMFVT